MEIQDVEWFNGEIDKEVFDKLRVNRNGYLESETHRQCTNCLVIHERHSKTMKICKACNSERVKGQDVEVKMWRRAKRRAKEKGLTFEISVEDIKIPRECPVLGVPLYVTKVRPGAFLHSPSLDRIEGSRGYAKDNIQVIRQLANSMKGAATEEQLVRFAQWVLQHYRQIDIGDLNATERRS